MKPQLARKRPYNAVSVDNHVQQKEKRKKRKQYITYIMFPHEEERKPPGSIDANPFTLFINMDDKRLENIHCEMATFHLAAWRAK